jgi:thioredoxin-related protein
MQSKKLITLSVLAITVFFVYYSVNAAPLIDDGEYTYISNIQWYNNYDEGLVAAQTENKPMLVYAWAIWCKFCKKLHEEVYPDPRIAPILQNDFILVAIDLDTNRKDTDKFSFSYPPKLVFLDPTGEKITEIPGYVPADTLLPILEQIKTIHATTVAIPKDLPRTEDRGGE